MVAEDMAPGWQSPNSFISCELCPEFGTYNVICLTSHKYIMKSKYTMFKSSSTHPFSDGLGLGTIISINNPSSLYSGLSILH